MTAKEYLQEQGIHPTEPIYWYGEDEIITLEQVLEDYHQAKLKLLGIADVLGRSEQCLHTERVWTIDPYDQKCFKCVKCGEYGV